MKSIATTRVIGAVLMLVGFACSASPGAVRASSHPEIVVNGNTDISFYTSEIPVTTSTGKKVYLLLNSSSTGSSTSEVELYVTLSTGTCVAGAECPPGEVHSWRFILTSSTFGYSVVNKTAELSSAAQIDPMGSAYLSFVGTSSTPGKCTSGSELIQTGTVTGNIYFSTGGNATTPWGLVKGKTSQLLSFKAPKSQIWYDNECRQAPTTPPVPQCVKGAYWYSPLGAKTGVSFIGILDGYQPWGQRAEAVTASRQVYLSAPAQSYRIDQSYDFAPITAVYSSLKLAAIFTGGSMSKGFVTGSAFVIFRGKPVQEATVKCKSGGKVKKQYSVRYASSGWAEGSSDLTARSGIGGNMTV